METLALLFIGHALADYPLQGDWIAKAKNHKLNLVPGETIWPSVLACHAAIHAGFVWAITGSGWLGLGEFLAHTLIDFTKSDGRLTYNQDQLLHVLCKVVWFMALVSVQN